MKIYNYTTNLSNELQDTPNFDPRGEQAIQALKDIVRGLHWPEVETTEQNKPSFADYLFTLDNIDIYYDFGADYYFFTEET